MISRFRLVLLLTLFVPGLVCGQTDKSRLAQVRAHYETARTFESKGNWIEAEKAWRAALELAPDDARAWTNLGVALNRQHK
ncbi:MAG: tetratricopeptide repeat protein, partial [Pyrinomonadaceae bacterium]